MFVHKKLVCVGELLSDAVSKKVAIGAFNFANMEVLQAIVDAANEVRTPVILQVSESAIKYMGFPYLKAMVAAAAENSNVQMALHLDHGKNVEICRRCIDEGFSSVMIDASVYPIDENIQITKSVISYARKFGVSVEGEVGALCGVEDDIDIEPKKAFYTNPDEAYIFARETGVDSLAIAIGTSHGPNKGRGGEHPKLSIGVLQQIKECVGDLPLVLHGASSVYQDLVELCNEHGAELSGTSGITDSDIREAVQNGIAKVNVDTDIRIAFLGSVRKSLRSSPSSIDIREHLCVARASAKNVVLRKMQTFL
jgi:fructose-bisphosphate aldolase class II